MHLLEQAGLAYSSLVYSHGIYGNPDEQHLLVDGLLDHCRTRQRHGLKVWDDFLDKNDEELLGGTGLNANTAPR